MAIENLSSEVVSQMNKEREKRESMLPAHIEVDGDSVIVLICMVKNIK